MKYKAFTYKEDGTRELVLDGYPSKGYLFASLSKFVIDCEVVGNSERYIYAIIEDEQGREYYKGSSYLRFNSKE